MKGYIKTFTDGASGRRQFACFWRKLTTWKLKLSVSVSLQISVISLKSRTGLTLLIHINAKFTAHTTVHNIKSWAIASDIPVTETDTEMIATEKISNTCTDTI